MNITNFDLLFSEGGSFERTSVLSDSILRTEDGFVFNIHRFLLVKDNRYFRDMFFEDLNNRDFLIPGIRGEILDIVLTFIYKGTVHLTERNVCDILMASDYLSVDGLTSRIKKYFIQNNMSLHNTVSMSMTAMKINREDIARLGYRFVQTHFSAIVNQLASNIEDLPFDIMKELVNDRNLCVESERDTWSAIVKWTKYDAKNRLRCVPQLIKCLKILKMEESLVKEILFSEIVAKNPFCKDLLNILVEYNSRTYFSPRDLLLQRRPECIHAIACLQYANGNNFVEVFLTYDENVDMWRKLGEIEYYALTHFVAIGCNIYMFSAYGNTNIVFNLVDKQRREMPDFLTYREDYHVCSLRNRIYLIGGEFQGRFYEQVEFYDPSLNLWFPSRCMFPVTSFEAISFQDSIFVVGKMMEEMPVLGMVAQFFNIELDSWRILPAPNVVRSNFALAGYHRKLYIIGGSVDLSLENDGQILKSVEVYDLNTHDTKMWRPGTDIPYEYKYPQAAIINGKLVVYDGVMNTGTEYPPVFWKEADCSWKELEASLPVKDLHRYLFSRIDYNDNITPLVRDPSTQFKWSPFA